MIVIRLIRTGYWIGREVKRDVGQGIPYGGFYTESKMSEQTVSEVGVDGDKIINNLKENAVNSGVFRLANNGHDGFMREDFQYFFDGRIHGGRNTKFMRKYCVFVGHVRAEGPRSVSRGRKRGKYCKLMTDYINKSKVPLRNGIGMLKTLLIYLMREFT